MTQQPGASSTRTLEPALRVRQAQLAVARAGPSVGEGDVLPDACGGGYTKEACMQREKTIGQPCAGNPHARLERGPQETERARHRA